MDSLSGKLKKKLEKDSGYGYKNVASRERQRL